MNPSGVKLNILDDGAPAAPAEAPVPVTGADGRPLSFDLDVGPTLQLDAYLAALGPERGYALFTQDVMRGPSPLPPWQRELIAAFTSKLNQCLF